MARQRLSRKPSVDRGYAFVVLASCFVIRMLVDSFWSSLGILFLRWQADFDVSAYSIAWIGSVFTLILMSTGVGLGFALQPGTAFFVVYFEKWLVVANGLNSAASAVGFLTLPPLMELMISHYGWRGALQITSAIMANICLCGVLLRSPPKEKEPKSEQLQLDQNGDASQQNNADTYGSFFKEVGRSFDLSLFRNLRFILQGVGNGFLYGANNTAIIYLIPYAVSVGIPDMNASYLMLAFGISGLITRLCPVGWVVDRKIIAASTLGGLAFFTSGVNIVIASFVTSFTVLVAVAVVFGVTFGIASFLRMVVVINVCGSRQKALGGIGWTMLFEGVGSFSCILLMGFLHELTGTYQLPLIVSGLYLISLGTNMMSDPCVVRCQQRRDYKGQSASTNSTQIYSNIKKEQI